MNMLQNTAFYCVFWQNSADNQYSPSILLAFPLVIPLVFPYYPLGVSLVLCYAETGAQMQDTRGCTKGERERERETVSGVPEPQTGQPPPSGGPLGIRPGIGSACVIAREVQRECWRILGGYLENTRGTPRNC